MEQNNPNSTQEALTRMLHDLLDDPGNEEAGEICVQEEKVKEMMQELYKEIIFSSSHVSSPKPSIFIEDAKNGSCGTLVSSSKSTMMAGIEIFTSTSRFPTIKKGLVETEKENYSKTLFRFREEKNGKKNNINRFRGENHLDCEWVGSVLRKWWSFFDTN